MRFSSVMRKNYRSTRLSIQDILKSKQKNLFKMFMTVQSKEKQFYEINKRMCPIEMRLELLNLFKNKNKQRKIKKIFIIF